MQTFIDRYIEQGWQQGLFKGIEQGRQEGQVQILLRQVTCKFGALTAGQRRRIEQADGDTLLAWSERLLEAKTLDEMWDG